jgi:predicted transcriptional regulator of viral defense system
MQLNQLLHKYSVFLKIHRRFVQKQNMINELPHKNGYIFTKEARGNRNLFNKLKKLIEEGLVEKLKPGIYKIPELATLNHWQEITLMYPKAVICLTSASAYYNLTTYIPHKIHLAIGQKANIKTEDYPPVQFYYWTDKYFKQHIVNNDDVQIFSLERTVCDIVRVYRNSDVNLVKEVAKEYLKRKDTNIALLMNTAKEIDMEDKVKEVFELLV